tara:strand:+ start:508 stop:735 length:228 start_codon:yes stop_codon:yes gene_type:complete
MPMAKAKRGQPKKEPTGVRSVRLPNRLWKLVEKQSKNNRSVNEYITSVLEDELINNDVLDSSLRKSPVIKNNGGK